MKVVAVVKPGDQELRGLGISADFLDCEPRPAGKQHHKIARLVICHVVHAFVIDICSQMD